MSDEAVVERAVGAGSFFEADGKEYQLSPLSIRSLALVQKEALRSYKKKYLETFADTIDLVENGREVFEDERKRVAKWSYEDLPAKVVHDPSAITVDDSLRAKLKDKVGEIPYQDDSVAILCAMLLDDGTFTEQELGIRVSQMKTEYPLWWATADLDGAALFVWSSLQKLHPDVTLKQVREWHPSVLAITAHQAQKDTIPQVGNT